MNLIRRLFCLLTVLAMLTIAFSGIGCDGGTGTSEAIPDYDSDNGQSEAGSTTDDGASGGVDVPLPAGSGTSGDTDNTEPE